MAATRNKNTAGNFTLHQRDMSLARNYDSYTHYAVPVSQAMPTIGIRPTHMSRETFAENAIDIESSLFGINSTNLVSPQAPVQPQLKTIPSIAFFERLPVIMPLPLVVEKDQRPYPI
jgi:hypothetical protein